MDDILTMQVWIPRYKYKVWNYNSSGETSSEPQEIEIMFEKGTNKTGDISCVDNIQGSDGDGTSEVCKLNNKVCTDSTCNGKTYTHPAFTFGNKEITGFWMSKFELRKEYYKVNGEQTYSDVFKPNLGLEDTSYTYNQLSYRFEDSLDMSASNNDYGLSTNIDTHMIKNSEWGAVAYLSYSKYGTCTDGKCVEVGLNDDYDLTTGCGADSSSECNKYDTESGMLSSTTQNIYGIYYMSGGMNDYVMGNMVSADGKTMLAEESGFDTYPDERYYDKYSYGTGGSEFKRGKLGDGIKEIYKGSDGWYGDILDLVSTNYPWYMRGAYAWDSDSGLFTSNSISEGDVDSTPYVSTHVVITP